MYAFFVSLFVLVIGGVAFLYSSKFLVRDVERCKANAAVNGEQPLLTESDPSTLPGSLPSDSGQASLRD